jgi:tetratricopeptide (TPR) repeat protein
MHSAEDEATKQGNLLREKGDFDGAIAAYTEAIRLDPQNAPVYSGRAYAHFKKGEFDQAIVAYSEAIRLDPKYAEAYCNRGLAYGKKSDQDKAIADFTEAIRLNPEDAEAYYNRGCTYVKKGDHDKGINDFTAAIRINPNDGYVYYARGFSYRQKDENAQADVDFAKAEELGFKAKLGRPDWLQDHPLKFLVMKCNIKENSFIARLVARIMKSNELALVIGKTIYLNNTSKEEFLKNESWVKHELVHICQFQQYGFLKFTFMYLWEFCKVGYWNNKYELEARAGESS